MPQSLANLLVHLVFSTKNRTPYLQDDLANVMHAYLGAVLRDLECPALSINGMSDHVHILFNLSRTESVAGVVKRIKSSSSAWIKKKSVQLDAFQWQSGYGAFSIGQSQLDDLRSYIERQQEHHKTRTFEDEFRAILTKYGLEWDERYVWV